MTELSARLGLYVAIDQAALDRDDVRDSVADAIPVYRADRDGVAPEKRQGALGWSRHIGDLLPEQPIHELEDALGHLGSLEDPRPLEQARRFKAVWALTQTVPGIDRALLAGALVPVVGAARSSDGGRGGVTPGDVEPSRESLVADAERLVGLLEDETFASAESFTDVVGLAAAQQLISADVAELASIGCEDSVTFVEVERDGTVEIDPAAHIVSTVQNFEIGSRSFTELHSAMDPARWPGCLGSFWCGMRLIDDPAGVLGPDVRAFHEQVGECPPDWFAPYLVFGTRRLLQTGNQDGFDLQYDLCPDAALAALGSPGVALAQDRRVEVDAGSVMVKRSQGTTGPAPGRVDITTSKTIRFAEPLPTGGIALLACISGWADVTREMMTGCLRTGP